MNRTLRLGYGDTITKRMLFVRSDLLVTHDGIEVEGSLFGKLAPIWYLLDTGLLPRVFLEFLKFGLAGKGKPIIVSSPSFNENLKLTRRSGRALNPG